MSESVSPGITGYDLIGDVHGCALSLERLLDKLGYHWDGRVYRHPTRQVVFLGDIIDRGPHIRAALNLVRAMVEAGAAHIVLGNHEFNALTFYTPHQSGQGYVRPHNPRTTRQLAETHEQFVGREDEWLDHLDWFRTLPLFLEWPDFRAVHACWDAELIQRHRQRFGSGHFDETFLHETGQSGTVAALTKQRLTGGVDLPLPPGMSMVARDGIERTSFRTKFWAPDARTYGELLFQPDPLPEGIAEQAILPEHRRQMVVYHPHEKPVFVGHYWLKGRPEPIAPNIACVDYSAVKFGRLVAYRFDGESQLDREKFVWTYVDP